MESNSYRLYYLFSFESKNKKLNPHSIVWKRFYRQRMETLVYHYWENLWKSLYHLGVECNLRHSSYNFFIDKNLEIRSSDIWRFIRSKFVFCMLTHFRSKKQSIEFMNLSYGLFVNKVI